jgi:hypothetical protein
VGRSGRRMGITVFHMEAGNRCFDANVPEEVNRRIIDHDADINLANAEHARRNLLTEGLHPMRIYVTGSPMWDVLEHFDRRMRASDITNTLGLEAGRFFLVSMHREENVDNETHLRSLLDALHTLVGQYDLTAVVSTIRVRESGSTPSASPATKRDSSSWSRSASSTTTHYSSTLDARFLIAVRKRRGSNSWLPCGEHSPVDRATGRPRLGIDRAVGPCCSPRTTASG